MIAAPPAPGDAPHKPGARARVSVTAAAQAQPYLSNTISEDSATPVLPVLDIGPFLERQTPGDCEALCLAVAEALVNTGCLVVRDPRVGADQSETFLDQMERYFSQPTAAKQRDSRPELHYQVGSTPEGTELPRCVVDEACQAVVRAQTGSNRATMPEGPDVKWRFMWRIGDRPQQTRFAELNSPAIIPEGFPDWAAIMDSWGGKMLGTVQTVAQMAAQGLGLPSSAFTEVMHQGPHLLAPTGCDLDAHGRPDTCIAGFHYDLNFLTIHGKSRFPGLFVWLRDGRRVPVAIPQGCLLLQAGKQLEWLTAGHVRAGMHEVVFSGATAKATNAARKAGRPLWRVSSTMFAHAASDQTLRPLGRFAQSPQASQYPPVLAGLQVQKELDYICLGKPQQ